eukprot:1143152-Rhodomonas_salina.1
MHTSAQAISTCACVHTAENAMGQRCEQWQGGANAYVPAGPGVLPPPSPTSPSPGLPCIPARRDTSARNQDEGLSDAS